MVVFNKLKQVRIENKSTTKQKLFSIISVIIFGFILGLAAKLTDYPEINPAFSDISGRLGMWIFTATLLSIFSYSPKLAAAKTFFFFTAVLAIYYVYTVTFLHFFPEKGIFFWSVCAIISPVCSYFMWYAKGDSPISIVLSALPIAILLAEGFELRHAYLPIHRHYYLIPWLMAVYVMMIVVLLLIVPLKKVYFLYIVPISVLVSIAIIHFNVLGGIFGGMSSAW